MSPPEQITFVCKLSGTRDEDLELILQLATGRFCHASHIRDKRLATVTSLCLYRVWQLGGLRNLHFKMQGVLSLTTHRIHIDFSQSVSRLADALGVAVNSKTTRKKGGFGGEARDTTER